MQPDDSISGLLLLAVLIAAVAACMWLPEIEHYWRKRRTRR